MITRKGLGFFAVVLFCSTTGWANRLGDEVGKMAVKSWRPIIGSKGSADFRTGSNNPITIYSNKAVWDEKTEKILYVGSPHAQPWNMVIYEANTDTWKNGPLHSQINSIHSYDNNTINLQTGEMYFWPNHAPILKFDPASEKWSSVSGSSSGAPGTAYGSGFVHFPEMNGFVHVYRGDVNFFDLASNSWRTLKTGLDFSSYHQIAIYNPVHKMVFLGGGNGQNVMYKLTAGGNFEKVTMSHQIGINSGLIEVDPVTGKFIVLEKEKLWAYDVTNNTWEDLGPNMLPGYFDAVILPIKKYGVVAFVTAYSWPLLVYKYAEGGTTISQKPARGQTPPLLSISPNPFHQNGKVRAFGLRGQNFTVTVFDARGKMVQKKRATGEGLKQGIPLELGKAGNGVFVVRVSSPQQTLNKKFLRF